MLKIFYVLQNVDVLHGKFIVYFFALNSNGQQNLFFTLHYKFKQS